MRRFVLIPFLLLSLAHAQHSVTLNWTAPAGCDATCSYVAYRLNALCPLTITDVSTWSALPVVSSTQAIDTAVTAGSNYCYVVETLRGGMNSVPSNAVDATIPADPTLSGTITLVTS